MAGAAGSDCIALKCHCHPETTRPAVRFVNRLLESSLTVVPTDARAVTNRM